MRTIEIDFNGTTFILTSETEGDFAELCEALSRATDVGSVQLDNENSNWVDIWQEGELSYYGKEPE